MNCCWSILLGFILILFAGFPIAAAEDQALDTTRVREVSKPGKNLGAVIADVPGEILKLPVRTVRLIALSATRRPISSITSLVDFSAPVRRYVPIVGYSPNAGLKLGFGLRAIDKDFWDDKLDFKWYYSTNNYQSYQFRFRERRLFSNWVGVDLYYRYKKRPRQRFYGIGMDSGEDKEINLTLESSEFRLDVPLHAGQRVSAGLTGGFLITNLFDGKDDDVPRKIDSIAADPDYAISPGRLDGARYLRFGGLFTYDGRNSGGRPTSGFHILGRMVRYYGTGRSEGLGFVESNLDIRNYLDVWRERVLATRFYIQRFDADNNNQRATPINLISRLGGAESLRGYAGGRFIDNDLALASVEWRFPVMEVLDGFVFLDEGRVFEEITDEVVSRGWKYSAGFGLRVWNAREVSFMTTAAWSDEGSRFYVSGGANW